MNSAILDFHNPQNFGPEEIAATDGFRLLSQDEAAVLTDSISARSAVGLAAFERLAPELYSLSACRWQKVVRADGRAISGLNTYRTQAPLPEGSVAPNEADIGPALGDFVESFNFLSAYHHELMLEKGFWDNRHRLRAYLSEAPDLQAIVENAMDCQLLSLATTEISEVVEALRVGNPPDDKIPQFVGSAAECADVFLRLMDLSHERGWPVAEALAAKLMMNKGRQKMHGGKLF